MKIFIFITVCLHVQPVINVLNEVARNPTQFSREGHQNNGKSKSESARIFFGETAQVGEFPFVAALLGRGPKGREQFCGGALLSVNVVVTACHCVVGSNFTLRNPKTVEVSAGGVILSEKEFDKGETQLRVAVKLSKHPGCFANATHLIYDMGALHVDHPFILNENLNVVRGTFKPSHAYIDELSRRSPTCVTMGWGYTEGNTGFTSEELRKIPVVLMSPEKCAALVYNFSKDEKEGPNHFSSDCHVCVTGKNPNQTACGGDSGSPLVCEDGKDTTIIGVVSFGPGSTPCGIPGIPTVFARIELYNEFEQIDFQRSTNHQYTTRVSFARSLLVLVAFIVINVVSL